MQFERAIAAKAQIKVGMHWANKTQGLWSDNKPNWVKMWVKTENCSIASITAGRGTLEWPRFFSSSPTYLHNLWASLAVFLLFSSLTCFSLFCLERDQDISMATSDHVKTHISHIHYIICPAVELNLRQNDALCLKYALCFWNVL